MSLIASLLKFFGAFFGWLGDKQLLDAGEARGNAKDAAQINKDTASVSRSIRDASNRERVRDKYGS